MGYLFKHLTVRLWASLITAALIALVILPPVAGFLGPAWMIVPVVGILAGAFWLTGAGLAALGRRRLTLLLQEAAVWDRAGMGREARQAFIRAADTVNSFFFSPLSRQKPAGQLLTQMTRFQLAQTEPEELSDELVDAYLRRFPHDRDAAVKWLETVLAGEESTPQMQDIASRIGAVHPQDLAVQRMLARIYLDERRSDFAALECYRLLLGDEKFIDGDLLGGMADLFLSQSRADTLALRAYLAQMKNGSEDARLLPAIAACCSVIHPNPDNLTLLDRADVLLGDIDPDQRSQMAEAFNPRMTTLRMTRPSQRRRINWRAIGAGSQAIWHVAGHLFSALARATRRLRAVFSSRSAKSTLKWAAMGLFMVGVGWLLVNTASHLAVGIKPAETKTQPMAAPITDPFTLQVAAYLKESDAQRYVNQLKKKGQDAYWTRASGGGKAWYQVRISHFKTKAEARAVGESLKTSGLIGDYYVANYKRPDAP